MVSYNSRLRIKWTRNLNILFTELKKIFCLFDKRGLGTVPIESIGDVLRAAGCAPLESDIDAIKSSFNDERLAENQASQPNHGVEVPFDKFVDLVQKFKLSNESIKQKLQSAFKAIDRTGNGSINIGELRYSKQLFEIDSVRHVI